MDFLIGTKKEDAIYGKKSADFIEGKNKSDYLYGGKGLDVINGGGGSDYLDGGKEGGDILIGGKGSDIFRLNSGTSTINDFEIGKDKIAVAPESISSIVIEAIDSSNGRDAVVKTVGGNMVINNILARDLTDNYDNVFVKYISE